MKILYSWLKEFVDIDVDPEELAERFNFAGIAVESLEEIKPTFTGVITGRLLEVKKHPNADKLLVCQVDTGADTLEIVCGASNIAEGQVVPVAVPGATLKNGKFSITRRTIRGVESNGMLCSEDELDIGDDASGIFILSDEMDGVEPGVPLEEVLNLHDWLFEFEIPSNRPDCFGIAGIAREAAAITGSKFKFPEFSLEESDIPVEELVSVEITAPDLCPRYSARAVVGVKNRRSPFWMRWRLTHAGLRPISALVDVTNYVMLETGQPLHAFDRRFIADGKIIVRTASEGEMITTLDGVSRVLKKDVLLIADPEKPVAIAGVMGAENSEVKEDTGEVIIESAHFNPASIMRTSRILGMNTDASTRFEKKVDPEGTVFAADRAACLMHELCGGKIARGVVDVYPIKHRPYSIKVRHSRIESVLGDSFSPDKVKQIFISLGFGVKEAEKDTYELQVPSFRPDITREIDAIEDVARIHGYDRIPSTLPHNNTRGRYEPELELENRLRKKALQLGFDETVSLTLMGEELAELFGVQEEAVKIRNPLSADLSILPPVLAPLIVTTVRNNFVRGNRNVRIFEIGRTFLPSNGVLPEEERVLGAAVCGQAVEKDWYGGPIEADFFDIKGMFEAVIEDFEASVEFRPGGPGFVDRENSAMVFVNGEPSGYIGLLDKKIADRLDIEIPVWVGELNVEKLNQIPLKKTVYREIPVYPAIIYDLSFLIDRNITYQQVLAVIDSLGLKYLEDYRLFDLYEGRGIPAGMKSMALRFIFRSRKKTLTEERVRPQFDRVISELEHRLGIKVRGSGLEK